MSWTEDKAVQILKQNGPMTPSKLGYPLWSEARFKGWNYHPCDIQRFARPAGKLLKRLCEKGLVKKWTVKRWNEWKAA